MWRRPSQFTLLPFFRAKGGHQLPFLAPNVVLASVSGHTAPLCVVTNVIFPHMRHNNSDIRGQLSLETPTSTGMDGETDKWRGPTGEKTPSVQSLAVPPAHARAEEHEQHAVSFVVGVVVVARRQGAQGDGARR